MHYKCYVYTKEFPTDIVLAKLLNPFCEEDVDYKNPPAFTWDWWTIGGRYCAGLKLKACWDDEKYHWKYSNSDGPRAGRLFRSKLFETQKRELAYMISEASFAKYCGLEDGFIRCDGGMIKELINYDKEYDNCFSIIDSDGTGYARETYSYGTGDFDKNENFDIIAKEVYERNRDDGYITIIDLHD